MRRRSLAAAAALLALFAAAATLSGANYGSGGPVQVSTEDRADGMDFSFKNATYGHLAVTLYFTAFENLRASATLPYLVNLAPRGSDGGFTVSQKDKSKRWDCKFMYEWRFGDMDAVHDDSQVYVLPFGRGSSYRVIQGYGGAFSHRGEFEYAVDFGMPEGTRILAAREGVVAAVEGGNDGHGISDYYWNRANYVAIEHSDGTIGYYVHCRKGGVLVKPGDRVRAGDAIALSGNVGYSSVPHLHFSVQKPLSGRKIATIPVRFDTGADGPATLEAGATYTAP